MEWDYSDSEKAVLGTEIHEFIWVFMRIVPFVIIGSIVGIILTRKKQ